MSIHLVPSGLNEGPHEPHPVTALARDTTKAHGRTVRSNSPRAARGSATSRVHSRRTVLAPPPPNLDRARSWLPPGCGRLRRRVRDARSRRLALAPAARAHTPASVQGKRASHVSAGCSRRSSRASVRPGSRRRPLPREAAAPRSIGLIRAHGSVAWIPAVRPSLLLFTNAAAARPPIAFAAWARPTLAGRLLVRGRGLSSPPRA